MYNLAHCWILETPTCSRQVTLRQLFQRLEMQPLASRYIMSAHALITSLSSSSNSDRHYKQVVH
jgi:hypothetical protein